MSVDDRNPEDFLPSDPVQRKKLVDCIQEIVNSKVRIQAENTLQKEAASAKAKECGVSAAKIKRYAASKFKGDISKRVEAITSEEAELQILFGAASINTEDTSLKTLNS